MGKATGNDGVMSKIEGRGIAVGYSREDKAFLETIFAMNPEIRTAFEACSKVYPTSRSHYVRVEMTKHERQVWADVGIPEGKRETLADHVAQMTMLASLYPQAQYDFNETLMLVGLWGMPKAIVSEIPLELMPRKERNLLENLAARMILMDQSHKHDFALWEKLREAPMFSKPFNNAPDAATFVHDLDFVATACKARMYQGLYPEKAATLETLVANCRQALLTPEAKDMWEKAVGKPPEIIRNVTIEATQPGTHVPFASGIVAGAGQPIYHAPENR